VTQALWSQLLDDEPWYHACTELFTGLHLAGRRSWFRGQPSQKVGYLLNRRSGPRLEALFLREFAEGDFQPVELTVADFARMADLVTQYSDLPLGTTDASVIAIAERLGITEVATPDKRHFTVVRPAHVGAFTLLP
jgi:predicted nucleic acid-binding protein